MSTIKVNRIENTSTTDGGVSIDVDGHVTIDGQQLPTAGPLSNRNLIINGAMQVAQRGTSGVVTGYTTVDRFQGNFNGGAVTQSQGTLTTAAGDAEVYGLGFRHYFRQTNTTTSTGASGHRNMRYRPEAQDVATSGWNYTSSTSYVTLSFWVRSSVAQEFYGYIRTENGTERIYTFSTGTLVADEWTKIEKTIPGDSSLEIPNDNTSGLQMFIVNPFWGTSFTDASVTLDTWRNYDTTLRTPPYTDTWAATTDATLDITGVQLELGSKATPFEHRSYGDELQRCKRYYQIFKCDASNGYRVTFTGHFGSSTSCNCRVDLSPEMRIGPDVDSRQASDFDIEPRDITITGKPTINESTPQQVVLNYTASSSASISESAWLTIDVSGGFLDFDSEL